MDPIDMLFFGLVGILMISSSKNNQRIGDVLGQTIVVKIKNLKTTPE